MSKQLAEGQAVERDGAVYLIRAIKPLLGDIDLEGKGGVRLTLPLRDFLNEIASGTARRLSETLA